MESSMERNQDDRAGTSDKKGNDGDADAWGLPTAEAAKEVDACYGVQGRKG